MKNANNSRALLRFGKLLEKIIYSFSRYIAYFAMAATVLMMLLATGDVFMRRIFNQPILGSYEISKVLLVILVFFGVAYVMTIKGHVSVDSLTRLYPKRIKIAASILAYFFSLLVVALISWQSFVYGLELLQHGEKFVLINMLVSPFIFITGFGSAILFLVILVQLIYSLAGAGEEESETPTISY